MVPPPLPLHPYGTVVERNRGPNLWHQPGPCWERRRGGAYVWILSPRRRLHLGSTSDRLPRAPQSSYCSLPTAPPCWESRLPGVPTESHSHGEDCAPDLLRLPTRPGIRQLRKTGDVFSWPPPPPKSDSASMMDQSQQQRLRNRSLRGKKPSDRGEPGNVVVLMDPPHRSLVSHALPASSGTFRWKVSISAAAGS